jgi:hypothetical protein
MERTPLEPAGKYGIMAIDAFSSDAIPIHLITLQAVDVYLDKLSAGGLLAFHISNRYLDLEPVLANLAEERGLAGVYQSDDDESSPGKARSTWVVLARQAQDLERLRELNKWEEQRKQLQEEVLPLAVWPDHGAGLAAQAALVYGVLAADGERHFAPWEPLKTRAELKQELKAVEEEVAKLKKEREGAGDEDTQEQLAKTLQTREKAKEGLAKRLHTRQKVGLWTDDYSNLLSVFSW